LESRIVPIRATIADSGWGREGLLVYHINISNNKSLPRKLMAAKKRDEKEDKGIEKVSLKKHTT
jgi:hypothetical protein